MWAQTGQGATSIPESSVHCAMLCWVGAKDSISKTKVATSSGEAEPYVFGDGGVGASLRKLLVRGMWHRRSVSVEFFIDPTAGKSMATRHGASRRTRHIELR